MPQPLQQQPLNPRTLERRNQRPKKKRQQTDGGYDRGVQEG